MVSNVAGVGERLEFHGAFAGLVLSGCIEFVHCKLAAHHPIALLSMLFSCDCRDGPIEFVPDSVNCLRLKGEVISLQSGFVKKVVDELVLIAIGISVTRNKPRQLSITHRE